jgi:hypothetical protein
MKYRLVVLLFIPILSYTQEYKVLTTPMLSFLYETKGNINAITNTSKLKLIPIKLLPDKLSDYYKIIKHNTGLYFLLNGSGQIYKATNLKEGYLYITRIDSTKFVGNTFFSIDFMYKDTLFSFGGYGFWHDNGQFRKYNQKYHELEIVKLNSRFKASMKSEYLDLNVSKLFYIQSPGFDEEFDLDVKEFSVISLDLINKKNSELGVINQELSKLNSFDYYIELPSLNGTLYLQNKNYYLLQYNKNLVYKLVNKKIIDSIRTIDGRNAQFTFEKNNKLYYCAFPDTSVKSIDISIKDFSLEPYSIYVPKSSIKNPLLV